MSMPRTLGELSVSCPRDRVSVKEEMRRNLLRKLEARETIFPGIVGYDDSVVPQIVNAVLSRHNMILLGLRGQAKSRILRSLTSLLDEATPVVAGCEINDAPVPAAVQALPRPRGRGGRRDARRLALSRPRYVEKLATPDVTIADIIGDIDPIRAARGGFDLASELTCRPVSSTRGGVLYHYYILATLQIQAHPSAREFSPPPDGGGKGKLPAGGRCAHSVTLQPATLR